MTDSSHDVYLILTNLEPYTRYAIYVQAYTVALQTTGKMTGFTVAAAPGITARFASCPRDISYSNMIDIYIIRCPIVSDVAIELLSKSTR